MAMPNQCCHVVTNVKLVCRWDFQANLNDPYNIVLPNYMLLYYMIMTYINDYALLFTRSIQHLQLDPAR